MPYGFFNRKNCIPLAAGMVAEIFPLLVEVAVAEADQLAGMATVAVCSSPKPVAVSGHERMTLLPERTRESIGAPGVCTAMAILQKPASRV